MAPGSSRQLVKTWDHSSLISTLTSSPTLASDPCDTSPDIQCNTPATIVPPDAPISFTATATDDCGASVEIKGFDCLFVTRNGREVDKTQSCVVDVSGDTITILDSGGVGDHIQWTVQAIDNAGNVSEAVCGIVVANPGQGC